MDEQGLPSASAPSCGNLMYYLASEGATYGSPLLWGDTFQDLHSGCLKLWLVRNAVYTMFFPIYTYDKV